MTSINFDYMSAAENMVKKGEYESALHYYFLERNLGNRSVNLDIANVYGAMGILHEAIKYYLRAYAEDKESEDALNGLIYCYKDIDEDASYYYLEKAMRLMGEDELEEFDDDLEEIASEPSYCVHDKRDKSKVLQDAYEMIEEGNDEAARKLLSSIDENSYQYSDALLALVSLEPEADGERVIELVEKALKANPANIKGHLFRVAFYAHKGNEEMLDRSLTELDALDLTDEEGAARAAMCFCNFKRFETAEKYILRKLKYNPYDRIMLLCLCSVFCARDDKQSALKIANKVATVYPDDIETKEVIARIVSTRKVNLTEEMIKLQKEWIQDIKKLFLDDIDNVTSPENIKKIRWLLQSDDEVYLQSAICTFITGMPEYDDLINDVLIDPFTQSIVKKQILLRRICDPKTKELNFVISNLFRSIKVKHPRVENNLKFAYYYVFIALAVSELQFETILDRAFKKLSEKYKKCVDEGKKELPINALAATLFYMAMDITAKESCSFFDCDEADFQKVAEMFEIKGDK